MKVKNLPILILLLGTIGVHAQTSCEELKEFVESKDYGTTYYSYSSDAIQKVSFHEVTDESYNTYYFAIVQFKSSYKEYIYQVARNTKWNYSMDYQTSAGKAFWEHIQPYNQVLDCAPNFN